MNDNQTISAIDVLIIGAGPAGASCALWLKLLSISALLIEKRGSVGGAQQESPYQNAWVLGQTNITGVEFAARMHRHLVDAQVPFLLETEIVALSEQHEGGFLVELSSGQALRCRFIVVATGNKIRSGGLRGGANVIIGPGHRFETYSFAHKRVALLGGGDNAFEAYEFLRERQPLDVKIYCRAIRAGQRFVTRVPQQDVIVQDVVADTEAMTVNGVHYDVIVVMFGFESQNPLDHLGLVVARDARGFVSTTEARVTSHSRVYAIGDVTMRVHPCVATAMSDGVIAAKDIQRRIESGSMS